MLISKEKSKVKDQKVLIMGLNNSGKTSIILSLKGETNLSSFSSIHATKGIDISEFAVQDEPVNLHIWDFGGQEKFRIGYLNNLKRYSTQTSKLIYVFDIQDTTKYDKALQYFGDIVLILEKEGIKLDLAIFLHKNDPNLEKINESLIDKVNMQLVPEIKKIIPDGWEYNIFDTTVFTVFKKILRE